MCVRMLSTSGYHTYVCTVEYMYEVLCMYGYICTVILLCMYVCTPDMQYKRACII